MYFIDKKRNLAVKYTINKFIFERHILLYDVFSNEQNLKENKLLSVPLVLVFMLLFFFNEKFYKFLKS